MKRVWILGIVMVLSLFFLGVSSHAKAMADNRIWTKSSAVVEADIQAGWPRVIKDGSTYKMWVEEPGLGVGAGTMRYTTSADGQTWAALQLTNLGATTIHEFCVIKDGTTYKMWYNSSLPGLASVSYRTSTDGLTDWSAATVITFIGGGQAWDVDYIAPWVIKDGTTYKMWYNASEAPGRYYLAYATSNDGLTFTEPQNLGQVTSAAGNTNNNLVLKQGVAGAWDGYQVGEALYSNTVLKNSDGLYEMWYAGNKSGQDAMADGYKIGYASSPDGIAWSEADANPVFYGLAGEYAANGVYYPSVILDGDTYKMWFWPYVTGWATGGVGYATANEIVVQAAEALPQTGGSNNLVILIGLVILIVSAPVFYLLQHKVAKN